VSVQGVSNGGDARYRAYLYCPPAGKVRSNLVPVPDRVPIGHDVPLDALSAAGLGLDYGTVRLERATEAWLIVAAAGGGAI
jgi:hypothetical protein